MQNLGNDNYGYLLKAFTYNPKTDTYGSSCGYNGKEGVGKIGSIIDASDRDKAEKASWKNPIIFYQDSDKDIPESMGYCAAPHHGFSANGLPDAIYSPYMLSASNYNTLPSSELYKQKEYLPKQLQEHMDSSTIPYSDPYIYDEFMDGVRNSLEKNAPKIKGSFSRFGVQVAPGFKFSDAPYSDLVKRLSGYFNPESDGRSRLVLMQVPMKDVISFDEAKNKYSLQRDSENEIVFKKGLLFKQIPINLWNELSILAARNDKDRATELKENQLWEQERELDKLRKKTMLPDSAALNRLNSKDLVKFGTMPNLLNALSFSLSKADKDRITELQKSNEQLKDEIQRMKDNFVPDASTDDKIARILNDFIDDDRHVIISDEGYKQVLKDLSSELNSKRTQQNILNGCTEDLL